jgi:membrane protease YdiL (CAAX protease family)
MRATEKETARHGLAVYFAVLIAGSAFFEWRVLLSGQSIDKVPLLILGLMYMPTTASLVARIALREGFGDISLRFGGSEGLKAMCLAWIYPMIVGFLAYGIAWISGLAEFQSPLSPRSHLYVPSGFANFLTSFLVAATVGTLVSCVSTFGEELGWRGYMLTRLIAAGVPKPILVSGIVWALWHVPIILSGQYAAGSHPRLSAALFVLGVIAEAYLVAFLRLRSGSIWPAVLMHGAWNAIIQGAFDRATAGTPLIVGESGWLTVTVIIAFVLTATTGGWSLYQAPGKQLTPPPGTPATTWSL